MGKKQIVAMKSDDNHRNKTTKNAIHKFNTELIETIGNRKHPPLDVNKDAAHLGRISNLVRIQHISWYFPSTGAPNIVVQIDAEHISTLF